jgi:hypothetical protein
VPIFTIEKTGHWKSLVIVGFEVGGFEVTGHCVMELSMRRLASCSSFCAA